VHPLEWRSVAKEKQVEISEKQVVDQVEKIKFQEQFYTCSFCCGISHIHRHKNDPHFRMSQFVSATSWQLLESRRIGLSKPQEKQIDEGGQIQGYYRVLEVLNLFPYFITQEKDTQRKMSFFKNNHNLKTH
jgi:hypothetical protein